MQVRPVLRILDSLYTSLRNPRLRESAGEIRQENKEQTRGRRTRRTRSESIIEETKGNKAKDERAKEGPGAKSKPGDCDQEFEFR